MCYSKFFLTPLRKSFISTLSLSLTIFSSVVSSFIILPNCAGVLGLNTGHPDVSLWSRKPVWMQIFNFNVLNRSVKNNYFIISI